MDLGYKPEEISLETTQSGRVAGYIVSDRFAGMDQLDRQNTLWKQLEQHLQPSQLVQIVAILTMTPGEV